MTGVRAFATRRAEGGLPDYGFTCDGALSRMVTWRWAHLRRMGRLLAWSGLGVLICLVLAYYSVPRIFAWRYAEAVNGGDLSAACAFWDMDTPHQRFWEGGVWNLNRYLAGEGRHLDPDLGQPVTFHGIARRGHIPSLPGVVHIPVSLTEAGDRLELLLVVRLRGAHWRIVSLMTSDERVVELTGGRLKPMPDLPGAGEPSTRWCLNMARSSHQTGKAPAA